MLMVIDYGVGNHQSVANALEFLGCDFVLSGDAADMGSAAAFILPGVGAFGEAMANLRSRGLVEPLRESVLVLGKPILGICLGMELLAESSEEGGNQAGLGLIPGHFAKLERPAAFPVPHVGWNDIAAIPGDPLYSNIEDKANFYFDHSYHYVGDRDLVSATCRYGTEVVASVRKGHVFGVQFHPEKSQRNGLKVLRGFCNLAAAHSRLGACEC